MAEFINTVDVLGDDAVMDSIIDRTITEFKDNTITKVLKGAFYGCTALTDIALPNVNNLGANNDGGTVGAFQKCTALTELTDEMLPSLTTLNAYAFRNCTGLKKVSLTNVTAMNYGALEGCTGIEILDLPNLYTMGMSASLPDTICGGRWVFPSLKRFDNYAASWTKNLKWLDFASTTDEVLSIDAVNFKECYNLKTVIVRSGSVATLAANQFKSGPIGTSTGTGFIYVPRALVDSYKVATNWSLTASKIRALEDYTVDGTITGEVRLSDILFMMYDVSSSNLDKVAGRFYHTKLESKSGSPVMSVVVTMNGEDVTDAVYNADTNEINIQSVTGDIVIKASTGAMHDIIITPFDGSDEGELPTYKLDVTKDTVIEVTYYLTKNQGVVYDGSNCNLNTLISANAVNTETTLRLTAKKDGSIVFGTLYGEFGSNGNLAGYGFRRPYGRYIFVDIV